MCLTSKKIKYYVNLDVKNITDNKMFWKTVKPLGNIYSKNNPSR